MQVDKTEDYEGIRVVQTPGNLHSFIYTHYTVLEGKLINKIKDKSITLVPTNAVLGSSIYVIHVHGDLYFTYKPLSKFPRFCKGEMSNVYLRKYNGKWERIPFTVYQYVFDLYTQKLITWDISNEVDYIERKRVAKGFDYYYTKNDTLIYNILYEGEQIWAASRKFVRRFENLFIMKQNDIIYVLITYKNEKKLLRMLLVKGDNTWFTLPPRLEKPVVSYFDGINHFPEHTDDPLPTASVKISRKVEKKIEDYLKYLNKQKKKEAVRIKGEMQREIYPNKLNLNLLRLKKSGPYVFSKSITKYVETNTILANRFYVFNKVVVGRDIIFDSPSDKPFLLVYLKYPTTHRVVKALSYFKGQVYYQRYTLETSEWVSESVKDSKDLIYLTYFDIGKDVDKRLVTKTELTTDMENSSYTCNQFIAFNEIRGNGRVIWKFEEPTQGPLLVSHYGRIYHVNFTDVHDGVKLQVQIKNDKGNKHFFYRNENGEKWKRL
ncbi:hypothetical protein BdWA1_002159 [Babesia duncani]|uniref:Uncharacterized protein n=1 Tax=Babesia duncani TaxID=323732 RepID=A0AAD9PL92_9APIC|nr:hypothetical protein BdWA1_002159 [Babesia duncani]